MLFRSLNSEQETFIKLYLPTITLRYSTHNSFIPPETYHVNIIGELPDCLFTLKRIESIRIKESPIETRTDYNISHLTTLTSFRLQSYERRERHVVLPLSLRHVDVDVEREDLNERTEDQIGNNNYLPIIQSLTNLTSLTLNHYNVPQILFPQSIVSINLKNSIINELSLNETTCLKSIIVDNCHITSLIIPPSVEHVKLSNCLYLKDVYIKGNPNSCHFDIKSCPLIHLN